MFKGVLDVHSMRVWALKSDYTAIALHLDVKGNADIINEAIERAHAILKRLYNFQYICVEVNLTLCSVNIICFFYFENQGQWSFF